MANVKFYSVQLKSTYDALEKDNLALYWIDETSELYKGNKLFGTGALATQAAAGLLSAEDKARLDTLVEASGKINLSAVDSTIVLTDTTDGQAIGVAVSAEPGNALMAVEDGLFVSAPHELVIPEYTIEKQETVEGDNTTSYKLKKTVGNVSTYIGDIINIDKDQEDSVIEVVDSISDLPAVADSVNNKLYYAETEKAFCFVHEGVWQKVNFNNNTTSSTVYETKEDAGKKLTEAKSYADSKVATVQGEINTLEKYIGTIPTAAIATDIVGYIHEKMSDIVVDVDLSELTDRVTEAEKAINDIEKDYLVKADKTELQNKINVKASQSELNAVINRLIALENGNYEDGSYEGGSDASAIAIAIAAQQDVAALEEMVGNIPDGITVADMINNIQVLAGDTMSRVDTKVSSVVAADNSVTIGGTVTSPTVAAKISADADNALILADDGLKVVISTTDTSAATAEYSIVKAENAGDYAAVYNLTKDGVIVGASINIPKDLVVKSGSVVDGNIVLVLNDETNTSIEIPVSSLIETVTSGSQTGDMIVITIDDDRKITATITDGTIGIEKLATDVQTKINNMHSHDNASVLAGITADQVATWDAAQSNAEATAAGALAAAVETLVGADDAQIERIAAIEDKFIGDDSVYAQIAEAKQAAINAATDAVTKDIVILSEAQAYTDQVGSNTLDTAYAYVNQMLTWGEF